MYVYILYSFLIFFNHILLHWMATVINLTISKLTVVWFPSNMLGYPMIPNLQTFSIAHKHESTSKKNC